MIWVHRLVALLPPIVGWALIASVEPFPHAWLSPSNPTFGPNIVRALGFFLCGLVLGMISYTMLRSLRAEQTISGGHPRKLLYRHVTGIAFAHGLLVAAVMFFIRERVNEPLSPATPVVIIGLVITGIALAYMLGYQNSRLSRHHSAKQILGVIEPADESGVHDLCLRAYGSEEQMSIHEWISGFRGGVMVRMTIEKVEEPGDGWPQA